MTDLKNVNMRIVMDVRFMVNLLTLFPLNQWPDPVAEPPAIVSAGAITVIAVGGGMNRAWRAEGVRAESG